MLIVNAQFKKNPVTTLIISVQSLGRMNIVACQDCMAHKGKNIDVTEKRWNGIVVITVVVVRRMMN